MVRKHTLKGVFKMRPGTEAETLKPMSASGKEREWINRLIRHCV